MIDDVDEAGYEGELDDETDFQQRVSRLQPGGDVELLLRELHEMVDEARPSALGAAIKIDRDAVLDVIDQAIEQLPPDLRRARWLLKEREEFLARTHREADEILVAARGQAERMVQRSEVLRAAEQKARRIVEDARTDAARLRNECDDYCDQRLVQLEAVLERTMAAVAQGREKLRPQVAEEDEEVFGEGDVGDPGYDDVDDETETFFDQDRD
jgi:hypothetical protein